MQESAGGGTCLTGLASTPIPGFFVPKQVPGNVIWNGSAKAMTVSDVAPSGRGGNRLPGEAGRIAPNTGSPETHAEALCRILHQSPRASAAIQPPTRLMKSLPSECGTGRSGRRGAPCPRTGGMAQRQTHVHCGPSGRPGALPRGAPPPPLGAAGKGRLCRATVAPTKIPRGQGQAMARCPTAPAGSRSVIRSLPRGAPHAISWPC